MAHGRITKTSVDALVCPPGKDREILWDSGKNSVPHFGVIAFPPTKRDIEADGSRAVGKKVFVVQFRLHGRSRRYTIGEYGALTPEQARKAAERHMGDVAHGLDPVEARKQARQVMTFDQVADKFIKEHLPKKKQKTTAADYTATIDNVLRPLLGSRRMVDIPVDLVSSAHAKMAKTPAAANKMLRVLSSIWGFASGNKWKVGDNPATNIEKFKEQPRERFLTLDEINRLGDAMWKAETIGLEWKPDESKPTAKHAPKAENRVRRIDTFAVNAIRLLALTGARKREILDAKWEFVNLDLKMMNLPDSKGGKKPILLPDAAVEILRTLPRIAGNPYIFPGEVEGKPRADLKHPWDAIRAEAALDGLRIHDLRHSFASLGVNDNVPLEVVGKLLGHKDIATTQRYAHIYNQASRNAVQKIGDQIAGAFAARDRQDNVVPLPKRRAIKNAQQRRRSIAKDSTGAALDSAS
jgi:integrase